MKGLGDDTRDGEADLASDVVDSYGKAEEFRCVFLYSIVSV